MINAIKKAMLWYYMLNKRLLKKVGFIVILAFIPLFAFSITFFVRTEETGLMRIALVAKDPNDPVVAEIINSAESDGNVFSFTVMDSELEAKHLVENKTIDAVWLFEDDFQNKVIESVNNGNSQLVTVYAVQDSIFFKASKEKIFSLLMPYISRQMYLSHVGEVLPEDASVTEEELLSQYQKYNERESIIDFAFLESEQADVEETNFITSTMRGLMAVIMLLAGLASTMYFVNDERRGIYSWLTAKKRLCVLLSSNFAAVFMAGIFVITALYLSHNFTNVLREAGLMMLFVMMTASFCSLIGTLFNSVSRLALAFPTLTVASLVLCPVFFNINISKHLQSLLPPYLYLYAVNDISFIKWMVLYILVTVFLTYVLYCVLRSREAVINKAGNM